MERAYSIAGRPPLRRFQPGLAGLARIIIAQQVTAASASAIWHRVDAAIGKWSEDAILTAPHDLFRTAGLSRTKTGTLRAVSEAIASGTLDLDALADAAEDDIHRTLTSVKGVGPWTADIYVLFCLGRADAFPAGDLALMTATAGLLEAPTRPNRDELIAIAERWRPWRGVAARLLWAAHPNISARKAT